MRYTLFLSILLPLLSISQNLNVEIICLDKISNDAIHQVQLTSNHQTLIANSDEEGHMYVSSQYNSFLKDTLFFSHPNYSFENTSLINLDGYISEKNTLILTVYGYKTPKRHVFDLPVTSTNKIVADSCELTIINLGYTNPVIRYQPNNFFTRKLRSSYGLFKKKPGHLNYYFLKLPIKQILDGVITVYQNGIIDSLLFERKNLTELIYINGLFLNQKSSINAQKNVFQFYETLDKKKRELRNQTTDYELKIENLENDLKKCKGTYKLLPAEHIPYPEEPFIIREYGLHVVEPKKGFSPLIASITDKLQGIEIEQQGIIKLSVTVNQNGYIKFSNEFSSKLHKEASMIIKKVLSSHEWVYKYGTNRNRIEHYLEFTFNLVPQ